MNKLISIIIPVYNVTSYIDACIESVVKQDYSNIEILLINDGSKDDSFKKCLEWKAKDNRITLINQEYLGVSVARNKGIDLAHGDYIAFVDSDDIVAPNYISELCKILEQENADISIGFIDRTDNSISIIPDDIPDTANGNEAMDLLCNGKIHTGAPAKLYKKDLVKTTHFIEGMVYEDNLFTFETIGKCQKVAFLKQFIYHYVINPGSITHTYTMNNFSDQIKAFELVGEYIAKFYESDNPNYVTRKLSSWITLESEFYRFYSKRLSRQECQIIKKRINNLKEDALNCLDNVKGLKLTSRMHVKIILMRYIPVLYYPVNKVYNLYKNIRYKIST